jgi:diaminopimelate decarboxylase/aspartate kinase
MDPGHGRGHHQHVRTAGKQSKFGIPPESAEYVAGLVNSLEATVIGLHSHAGSGILEETANWFEVAELLLR